MNAPSPNTRVRVLHADPFAIPPPPIAVPPPFARPVSRPGGAAIAAAFGLLLWLGIIGGVMWATEARVVEAVKIARVGR